MKNLSKSFLLWFYANDKYVDIESKKINLVRCIPYIIIHLGCFGIFFVECSLKVLLVCLFSYSLRVFALTAFYHRLFSHRAFKTTRFMQFVFGFIGACAAQRGPLWWASHHRHHHRYSDTEHDKHSPQQKGFVYSHFLWFLENKNFSTADYLVKDYDKYPELKVLNNYDFFPPLIYAILLYYCFGFAGLIWGFFVSTVLVYHVTFFVNSLSHLYGTRNFKTKDSSRNNLWLAILTFGEGWHNNHHFYPSSARQGFYWFEIDITYYILKIMEFFRIIWDLRVPPSELIYEHNNR